MDRYNPHPVHHILPYGFVLVSAILCYAFPSWQMVALLLVSIPIALLTSNHISNVGKVRAEEDYYYWVYNSVRELKTSDPEIWEALGFIKPPEVAKVTTEHKPTPQAPYYSVHYSDIHVPPALLEVFANGILSGKKTLSEGQWAGNGKPFGSKKYRDFQDAMLKNKLIVPVNPMSPTLGYSLTDLGEQWLLQYCSEGVRQNYKSGDITIVILGT